ncbi:(Fe-S)-binding protein [Luteolibacter sp. SL250]|uniref:(Fe-S)-binding protein n=1 Tax=Luteolibacter sp. SL250 TaxID=2995170 RepID=UPI0022721887|nr:(Fe-S)-binding protein [Luteolibacter sp. SL250]WAC21787.1 (Fe-S)-binding protein [Luteolibacter sp. SL250]
MPQNLHQLDYSILQQCMHCGMCLPTCPTYDTTKRERNSPRGRISLMRSIADGDLAVTESFADEMSYCLGCLACQTACPAGVDYATLFETSRAHIESAQVNDGAGRTFWRTLTLEILFTRPRLLRLTGRLLHLAQTLKLDQLFTPLLPANLRRLAPQAPRIAEKFSDDLIREREYPGTAPKHKVALLTGCIQDLAYSNINRDTADVLLANGCEVHTPAVQPCCGSLHSHNGAQEIAEELARRLIDLIPPDQYDAIITNAGGCGSHLKHYTHLLEHDPTYAAKAALWDAKVQDIHQFLAGTDPRPPHASPFAAPTIVTYHDSCHLAHGQKVALQPRAILSLIPGLLVKELPEANWCCGSAGVYTITQPEESKRLLDRKVANIRSTGATVLATANPGCHLQIVNGLKAEGVAMEVVHPISLLASAYRAESIPIHSTELS